MRQISSQGVGSHGNDRMICRHWAGAWFSFKRVYSVYSAHGIINLIHRSEVVGSLKYANMFLVGTQCIECEFKILLLYDSQ